MTSEAASVNSVRMSDTKIFEGKISTEIKHTDADPFGLPAEKMKTLVESIEAQIRHVVKKGMKELYLPLTIEVSGQVKIHSELQTGLRAKILQEYTERYSNDA